MATGTKKQGALGNKYISRATPSQIREFLAAESEKSRPSGPRPAPVDPVVLRRTLARIAKRKAEALSLYVPLPKAAGFHASSAMRRVVDGSNQSGKTLTAAVEIARALLGVDPYDKWPKSGAMLILGLDGDHLGDPMYTKLHEPGAFSMIRDEHTLRWRAVRWRDDDPTRLDPYDEAYREKWRDAPPLIPPRCVRRTSWEDRGKGVPRITEYTSGWKATWRSSRGPVVQGRQPDGVWIDEQIENEQHFVEAVRGLMRRSGLLLWSATPQTLNDQLWEIREMAEADPGGSVAFACKLLLKDNPFISQEDKEAFYKALSPEDRIVRWDGEYYRSTLRIYSSFDIMGPHGVDPFPIPDDWACFMILDPGRQAAGTLFVAVDPENKHRWVYDGFELKMTDAGKWADEVAKRVRSRVLEAVICDFKAGKQHGMGDHMTIAERWWGELEKRGIAPRMVNRKEGMAGFFPGAANIPAREEALLSWMRVREDGPWAGTSVLQVFRGQFPELEQQIKKASHQHGKRITKYESESLDCLEYAAAEGLWYHKPPTRESDDTDPVLKAFQDMKRRKDR